MKNQKTIQITFRLPIDNQRIFDVLLKEFPNNIRVINFKVRLHMKKKVK
jgi:hypothetical protein